MLNRCKIYIKVGGEGFEPSKAVPADLQSVPFGHSGIRPDIALISSDYNTTDSEKNQVFCEHLSAVFVTGFVGLILPWAPGEIAGTLLAKSHFYGRMKPDMLY